MFKYISVNNFCVINPCHPTALCTPSINPKRRTCLCADDQMEVPTLTVSMMVSSLFKIKFNLINFFIRRV